MFSFMKKLISLRLNGSFDFIGKIEETRKKERKCERGRKEENNIKFYLFIFMMRTTPPFHWVHCLCVHWKEATQKTVSELQFGSSGIGNAIKDMFFFGFIIASFYDRSFCVCLTENLLSSFLSVAVVNFNIFLCRFWFAILYLFFLVTFIKINKSKMC